jgi:polysaccharide export outer membrane protein
MNFLKNIKLLFIFFCLLFINNCGFVNPGMNNSPSSRSFMSLKEEDASMNDVTINFIDLNQLKPSEIKKINLADIKNDNDFSIKKNDDIYNYVYEYFLGAGDKILINFNNSTDSNGSYTIGSDGSIDLPFIGNIILDNLTNKDAKKVISQAASKFYKDTEFQLKIEEYNSSRVFIVGTVKNQIAINLNHTPLTVLDAVIKANFSPSGNDNLFATKGFLRRNGKIYQIDIQNTFLNKDSKENFFLKKGDVIFLDKNPDGVYVFGEFSKPGIFYPGKNYSLTELIATAGITQSGANVSKIFVIRENVQKYRFVDIFRLDADNPANLIAGRDFLLRPYDIVVVPPVQIVQFNKMMTTLIGGIFSGGILSGVSVANSPIIK